MPFHVQILSKYFVYIYCSSLRFCVYDDEPFGVSSSMTAAPENGVDLVLTVVSLHSTFVNVLFPVT